MIKKQSFGIWFNVLVVIFALISVILYNINISGVGYFKGASIHNLILYCVLAMVFLIGAIILAQLNVEGKFAVLVEIVSGLLRIAAAVLLTLGLVTLISARAEGLGFIYFSNEDVLQEIQTSDNMTSATGTIVNMICLGAATVLSMVAAFLTLNKKEK